MYGGGEGSRQVSVQPVNECACWLSMLYLYLGITLIEGGIAEGAEDDKVRSDAWCDGVCVQSKVGLGR